MSTVVLRLERRQQSRFPYNGIPARTLFASRGGLPKYRDDWLTAFPIPGLYRTGLPRRTTFLPLRRAK